MNFIDFKNKLNPFIIFSLNDIRKIEVDFDVRRLSEWNSKGYIRRIRREYYMFADTSIDDHVLYLIANVMYEPSYISLETALSLHGLIPETVHAITSATSRKTAQFTTDVGIFSYRSFRPSLMFGYVLKPCADRTYRLAEPEKAVLDYLYLHPSLRQNADFEGMRFNAREFAGMVDWQKYGSYAHRFNSVALLERSEALKKYVEGVSLT